MTGKVEHNEESRSANKWIRFFKKYFLHGQKLSEPDGQKSEIESDEGELDDFILRHRKKLGILIPVIVFQIFYWLVSFKYQLYLYYKQKYLMAIVMIFGGLVGGMTTEGGGAIAYPVMTLALNISSTVARDFSFMIQSCGLSASTFTIFFTNIMVEWHSILFCSAGAIIGLLFGLEVLYPLLTASTKKMIFVSVFFSFALALFVLNKEKKRTTFNRIQNFNRLKALILIINGMFGGIFTAIAGSGVDVYSFSILTLLFRIDEKVATPTSVILMATNSTIGFFWRFLMQNSIEIDSWEYLIVCAPVVVVFAPIGSFIASYLHRLTLATIIYILETIALFGALVVVQPSWPLAIFSFCLILISFFFYTLISYCGKRMIEKRSDESNGGQVEEVEKQKEEFVEKTTVL